MNENNIQKLALRMKLITVEDMCQYTIAQLVYMLANKVNEMITNVSEFENDIDETVKTQNENIQNLLGEGLHLEVVSIFEKWVEDGTFNELINQSALEKVNTRMTGLINNILSEGAKSDNESFDNAVIINRMITSMPNGGVIQIPVGKFYIKSPIILKPHITLQGVGSTTPDGSSNGSMICLSGEVSDIDMVVASGTEEGYCYGVSIKNIGIEGHGGALTGIKLSDCSRTLIEKVDIHYCNIGL